MATNISSSRSGVTMVTNAPRLGFSSIRPVTASWRRASRIGVRETWNR
jgi:hypothetical protein